MKRDVVFGGAEGQEGALEDGQLGLLTLHRAGMPAKLALPAVDREKGMLADVCCAGPFGRVNLETSSNEIYDLLKSRIF